MQLLGLDTHQLVRMQKREGDESCKEIYYSLFTLQGIYLPLAWGEVGGQSARPCALREFVEKWINFYIKELIYFLGQSVNKPFFSPQSFSRARTKIKIAGDLLTTGVRGGGWLNQLAHWSSTNSTKKRGKRLENRLYLLRSF